MTEDLIARLRFHGRYAAEDNEQRAIRNNKEREQAAATIESLTQENATLRDAMRALIGWCATKGLSMAEIAAAVDLDVPDVSTLTARIAELEAALSTANAAMALVCGALDAPSPPTPAPGDEG